MDWDSWGDIGKSSLKESKNWFHWWYYGLAVIPLLVGAFLGAQGGNFRFFPLILLAITIFFGKTAISIFALLYEREGKRVIYYPYIFEASRLPFSDDAVRFCGYLTAAFSVVCGFVLCLVSGFGMLSFGVLAAAVAMSFLLGYISIHYGINLLLSFFSSGVLITVASFYAQCGYFSWSALGLALPIGFMLSALILRHELDGENGLFESEIKSLPQSLGIETAERLFTLLFALGYIFIVLNVFYGVSGFWALFLLVLLPLAKAGIRSEDAFLSFYIKFGFLYAFCMLLHFTF